LSGRISLQGGRRLGSFRFKLVAWFALLALLPIAVAFYGYDSLARRSEDRRADAAREAALRVAVAGYTQHLDAAATAAQRLAAEPRVQRALRTRDRAALTAIAAATPPRGWSDEASAPARSAARGAAHCRDRRRRASIGTTVAVGRRPPGSPSGSVSARVSNRGGPRWPGRRGRPGARRYTRRGSPRVSLSPVLPSRPRHVASADPSAFSWSR
jgi:hypothetical protein